MDNCASSDQQIWTLMDITGHSGNALKVPGSRPGRPTEAHEAHQTLNAHARGSQRSRHLRVARKFGSALFID